MASLQSLVRTSLAMREGNLARFAKELSERLYEETAEERFITLFLGILDMSTLAFQYVNAGHNPPLFFRKWTLSRQISSAENLDKGASPLGLLPQAQYLSGRVSLQEGDVLVLYTDGLTDAINGGAEQFGEDRLREVVGRSLSLSASEICQQVVDQLDAFSAETPQWDDVTLAVMKVKSEIADLAPIAPGHERGSNNGAQ